MSSDKEYTCQRCGDCCEVLTIPLSGKDLKRWKDLGRWDLFHHVKLLMQSKDGTLEWIVKRPKEDDFKDLDQYEIKEAELIPVQEGKRTRYCAFLVKNGMKYSCSIYKIRPEACADFFCMKK